MNTDAELHQRLTDYICANLPPGWHYAIVSQINADGPRPDILAFKYDAGVAIEVSVTDQSDDDYHQRQVEYDALDFPCVWVVSQDVAHDLCWPNMIGFGEGNAAYEFAGMTDGVTGTGPLSEFITSALRRWL